MKKYRHEGTFMQGIIKEYVRNGQNKTTFKRKWEILFNMIK